MGVEGAGSGSGLELMVKSETKESIGENKYVDVWDINRCCETV
jgi:hypothetical protein